MEKGAGVSGTTGQPPAIPFGADRISSLDGLRALSIGAMLFAHASKTGSFPGWLGGNSSGKLGVRVFFVISGFLITSLLLKEFSKTGRVSLKAFYLRRAIRILPVYYCYILAVGLISWLGLRVIPPVNFFSAGLFVTDLWGEWYAPQYWPLAHTWSLSIEEQFYLTWPALLAFLGPRFGGRLWIPFLLLLAPVMRWWMWPQPTMDHLFVAQGDAIASGCLLALLRAGGTWDMKRVFAFHPALCRIAAGGLLFGQVFIKLGFKLLHLEFPWREVLALMPSLQCILIAYLIGSFVTHRSGWAYVVLNLAAVQWVGRLSYSLYIWQQLVLVPVGTPVFPGNWSVAAWGTRFPQNLGVVVGLACLSYYCLEKPLLAWRARLAKVSVAGT